MDHIFLGTNMIFFGRKIIEKVSSSASRKWKKQERKKE